jgi:hypothetical protein
VESSRSSLFFIADEMIKEIKRKSKKNNLVPKDCNIWVFESGTRNTFWNVHFSYPVSFKDIPGGQHRFVSRSPDIYDPYEVQCVVDALKNNLGIAREDSSFLKKIENFNWKSVVFFVFLFGIISLSLAMDLAK